MWLGIAVFFVVGQVLTGLYFLARLLQYRRFVARSGSLASFRAPGISILTSLKGPTPHLAECLLSLMDQDYPGELELVIATLDEHEPLLAEARAVLASRPHRLRVQWIAPVHTRGLNPRTAKIHRAYLAAHHDWRFTICVDTRFDSGFLRKAMARTRNDPKNFVTGFPVVDSPRGLAAVVEAVGLNVDVAQFFLFTLAGKKGTAGYGGAMLFHRQLAAASGAYAPLLPLLTDDVTLARALTDSGGRCLLAPGFCRVRQEEHSLNGLWKRQVRWRMIGKYFLPSLYFLSPLSWVIPVLVFAYFATGVLTWLSLAMAFTLWRILLASLTQTLLGVSARDVAVTAFALPLYDLYSVPAWCASLLKSSIAWGPTLMKVNDRGAVTETNPV